MSKHLWIGAAIMSASIGFPQSHAAPTSRDLSVQQVKALAAGKKVGSLQISAWVNRKDKTYARGDVVRLFVANKSKENVYLSAFDIGPETPPHVIRIFPNKFQKSQLIKSKRTVEIGGHKHHAQLVVAQSQPVGPEVIKIIASTKPGVVVPVSSLKMTGPFFLVKGGVPELVRDLEITPTPHKKVPTRKIAVIGLTIKTVAKR